jgi:hypothetical protein
MDSSRLGLRLGAEALGTFLFFFLGFHAIAVLVDIGGGAISNLGIAFVSQSVSVRESLPIRRSWL